MHGEFLGIAIVIGFGWPILVAIISSSWEAETEGLLL
jgi:hypothetical protein